MNSGMLPSPKNNKREPFFVLGLFQTTVQHAHKFINKEVHAELTEILQDMDAEEEDSMGLTMYDENGDEYDDDDDMEELTSQMNIETLERMKSSDIQTEGRNKYSTNNVRFF